MNVDERMEANAIIERMTESDGDHFDRRDAERLVALVPIDAKPSRFTATFSRMRKSDSAEGYAAGVGNVSVDDGKEERVDTVLAGGRKFWRVGGYEVEHLRGVMIIRKMWSRMELGGNEEEVRLSYGREPITLSVRRNRFLSIFGFLEVGYGYWDTWKTAR